jgi:putative tricarboxylic transport membrane protein
MEILGSLLHGFAVALTVNNILCCAAGVFFGQIVGVLPGLGAPTAIALLLPITFTMNPTTAIIMLAGIYYGVAYGGTLTSVLINVPGESSTVMTTLDGHQMALQGRAGPALSVAAIGSFIAATLSILLLMSFAPALAKFALKFGPPEYFGLTAMAFGLLTVLGGGSPVKVVVSTLLGLFMATMGFDVVGGVPRFAFGVPELLSGIDPIVIITGMFGIAEVFNSLEEDIPRGILKMKFRLRDVFLTWQDWVQSRGAILRGWIIGFIVGVLPAGGITTASFLAYLTEKRLSKRPERFGKGAIEGVAAPESANNAASISGFAPLLALGLPSSPTTAILLAGFMMWGLRPGPMLFQTNPDLVWGLIASMYLGNLMLLLMNLFTIPAFVAVLRVPYTVLMGLIVVFSTVGAYSANNNLFDIWMMLGLGVLGYLMKKLDYPVVPLILALVLGKLAENSLRQALTLSGGSVSIFFTRPIAATFIALAILAYLFPVLQWLIRSMMREKA